MTIPAEAVEAALRAWGIRGGLSPEGIVRNILEAAAPYMQAVDRGCDRCYVVQPSQGAWLNAIGHLPTGVSQVRNSTGKPITIMPAEDIEAARSAWHDAVSAAYVEGALSADQANVMWQKNPYKETFPDHNGKDAS